MDEAIFEGLVRQLAQGRLAGTVSSDEAYEAQAIAFRRQFGPEVLESLDGVDLLRLMHERREGEGRCMAYWLEFKKDDELVTDNFGGIGGGSALKFGLYQREADGAWVTGSPRQMEVLPEAGAIGLARQQRDDLVRGCRQLAAFDPSDASDEAFADLQAQMQKAAPDMARSGWAHKYWYLVHSEAIDGFHSPQYQRFRLLKLLEAPPDGIGIRDPQAARFNCAGRFLKLARELGVSMYSLGQLLVATHRRPHRYWKVNTTDGTGGHSVWPRMRDQGVVSIGWADVFTADMTPLLDVSDTEARAAIRDALRPSYSTESIATRKAGEVFNFLREMKPSDIVLACDGSHVLGIGRITGSYSHDPGETFPHQRPVEWLHLEPWALPQLEGPQTTVFELGKSVDNILEIERRLQHPAAAGDTRPRPVAPPVKSPTAPLPPLDARTRRLDSVLRRKGQAILYGPPGTGKTFHALQATRELAARHAFGKTFAALDEAERAAMSGDKGLVELCSFHPGWGYEDFVEGLRPRVESSGHMTFVPRDGIFKTMCKRASERQDRRYFLVIDEFNRGDLPRIFGELMTALEPDKRKEGVLLPLQGERLVVPPNLAIVGTMNTADRSISLLDAALRRRFGFIELMPDSRALGEQRVEDLQLGPWLDALNARLRKHLKRDARNLQVGHAYLMATPPIDSVEAFARVLRDDIIPLLEDYCYEDFETLAAILGRELVDVEAACIDESWFDDAAERNLLSAVRFPEMAPYELSMNVRKAQARSGEADEQESDIEPATADDDASFGT